MVGTTATRKYPSVLTDDDKCVNAGVCTVGFEKWKAKWHVPPAKYAGARAAGVGCNMVTRITYGSFGLSECSPNNLYLGNPNQILDSPMMLCPAVKEKLIRPGIPKLPPWVVTEGAQNPVRIEIREQH